MLLRCPLCATRLASVEALEEHTRTLHTGLLAASHHLNLTSSTPLPPGSGAEREREGKEGRFGSGNLKKEAINKDGNHHRDGVEPDIKHSSQSGSTSSLFADLGYDTQVMKRIAQQLQRQKEEEARQGHPVHPSHPGRATRQKGEWSRSEYWKQAHTGSRRNAEQKTGDTESNACPLNYQPSAPSASPSARVSVSAFAALRKRSLCFWALVNAHTTLNEKDREGGNAHDATGAGLSQDSENPEGATPQHKQQQLGGGKEEKGALSVFHLLENTSVKGRLRRTDGKQSHFLLSSMATPIGTYPAALIRESDVRALEIDTAQ